MGKVCQSCAMPMNRDPGGGGTEADGSKTDKYCSLCYQDGAFTNPEVTTAKQMQDFCIVHMKQHGMPGLMAWVLTRPIPRLERWRQ